MTNKILVDKYSNISLSRGIVAGSSISGNPIVSKGSVSLSPTQASVSASVLLVGGGGSGGTYYAGGGGAGGGILKTTFTLPDQRIFSVVVGSGGVNSDGGGSGFNGGFCIGGGMGASGGNVNGPAITPTDGAGGGGAACGGDDVTQSYGATADPTGQIKAGGNGLYDDNRPLVFDALGGGGGGYTTAGGSAHSWIGSSTQLKNGGDGTRVSAFFPDLLNTQLDWVIGCGGGGACNWAHENHDYSSGGYLGGAVAGTNYGGMGGGRGVYSARNATNGFGFPYTGGAGNGGGGGFSGNVAGTGSGGVVLLQIPTNLWWNQSSTQSESPYFQRSGDINGFTYLLWYGSGTFVM
jgi:hypothetical protein